MTTNDPSAGRDAMSERQPIGPILDALDVRTRLNEGDLVADAVVILRIVNSNGGSDIRSTWSDGMDWITRRGLIEVARDADRIPPQEEDQ